MADVIVKFLLFTVLFTVVVFLFVRGTTQSVAGKVSQRIADFRQWLMEIGIGVKVTGVGAFGLCETFRFDYRGREFKFSPGFEVRLKYPGSPLDQHFIKRNKKKFCVVKDILREFTGEYYRSPTILENKEDLKRYLDELCDMAEEWDKRCSEGRRPPLSIRTFCILFLVGLVAFFLAMVIRYLFHQHGL